MHIFGIFRRPLAAGGTAAAILATALAASAQVAVSINGTPATFSPPPIERAGRIFVPLRGVFERLGASVVYANGVINAHAPGKDISLKVGSNLATVNGVAQAIDTPPFIEGASTYVPLRFVSQALGATVSYEQISRSVAINTPQAPAATPVPGAATLNSGVNLNGSMQTDISSATAHVGDTFAVNLVPPYPNDDTTFANAYLVGHVSDVVKAGQGRKAQLQLAFDKIVFPDGHTLPVAAHVTGVQEKKGSAIAQQAAGALGGMIVGNIIGKTVLHTNVGGAIGAAGGFLYANNLKTDVTIPKSSSVTIQTEQPRRQSTATMAPVR
ncbi:MAG: copper amine oxidase N-terminal domain-containing protein [Candidatus Eremiobacteraeota bacterium]|nr:copper amine oxidase N-terminal domain-containing protein [Candidatus Eremiobacteraeota bacterium]MBC5811587.1 copper amine oxidase N-terminal domain-containing protein [Candidatus Eremiobacteraeota bacterium]